LNLATNHPERCFSSTPSSRHHRCRVDTLRRDKHDLPTGARSATTSLHWNGHFTPPQPHTSPGQLSIGHRRNQTAAPRLFFNRVNFEALALSWRSESKQLHASALQRGTPGGASPPLADPGIRPTYRVSTKITPLKTAFPRSPSKKDRRRRPTRRNGNKHYQRNRPFLQRTHRYRRNELPTGQVTSTTRKTRQRGPHNPTFRSSPCPESGVVSSFGTAHPALLNSPLPKPNLTPIGLSRSFGSRQQRNPTL